MALSLDDKKEIVSKLSAIVGESTSLAVGEYKGTTVSEMEELRKLAREGDVTVGVYRNTLAKIAVKDTSFECIADKLVGPVMLLFSKDKFVPYMPDKILSFSLI